MDAEGWGEGCVMSLLGAPFILRYVHSRNVAGATNTPSPLRGEGWGEGESGVNLNHHPLPNPSPLKGEGLYTRFSERRHSEEGSVES